MKQRNTEKLSDKAFVRLIATSILGILFCIVCLCSTTYAWFTASVPSTQNQIKSANECLLTVSVYKVTEENADVDNLATLAEGKYTATLVEGVYTVTLSLPKDSASGYCLITVAGNTYTTDYIQRHEDPEPKTISFTISVAETVTAEFETHWGIYLKDGKDCVENGETLTIANE